MFHISRYEIAQIPVRERSKEKKKYVMALNADVIHALFLALNPDQFILNIIVWFA